MPLYKGNTKIGAIYKGTTPIGKIYKGTDLIFESARWLTQNYTNLYYDLIPTTISSRQVKNKARVKKIYGNGVIENQLALNGDFSEANSGSNSWLTYGSIYSMTSFAERKVIVTKDAGGGGLILYKGNTDVPLTANHTYLCVAKLKPSRACSIRFQLVDYQTGQSMTANQWNILTYLHKPTSISGIYYGISESSNDLQIGDTVEIEYMELIDLTHEYGTGQEPTTLTDNRIQNILNRGYIPHNTGTYKASVVGEIDLEPYNLWNNVLENGFIDGTGSFTPSTNDCSTDYIAVIPSRSYVFGNENFTIANGRRVFEYDENKNFIKNTNHWNTTTDTITLTNNTRYVAISYNGTPKPSNPEICIHLDGTRTGYAPHTEPSKIKLPAPLALGGALAKKNKFEITPSTYVFTSNVSNYTFSGTESWVDYDGAGYSLTTSIAGMKSYESTETANVVWALGITIKAGSRSPSLPEYTICVNPNGKLFVMTTKNATQLNSALQSKTIHYELATPQVIRIPRKHLAVVDLGTLTYTLSSGNYFTAKITNQKVYEVNSNINRMYCPQYLTYSNADRSSNTRGINLGFDGDSSWTIRFKDESISTNDANKIKQALSGIYLYYETNSEVADFDLTMNVESGGTINAYWFKWRENQLQSPLTATGWTSDIGTYSATNDRKATITLTSDTGTSYSIMLKPATSSQAQTITAVAGHTYLITFKLTSPKANGSTNRIYIGTDSYNAFYTISAGVNYVQAMIKFNGTGTRYPIITLDLSTGNFAIGDVITIEDYQVNDITLGELDATNINDPRIQYIIEHGYIPTNTAGTEKFVDCEVLPNVDLEVKCK